MYTKHKVNWIPYMHKESSIGTWLFFYYYLIELQMDFYPVAVVLQ
jgi:hypothetical protein